MESKNSKVNELVASRVEEQKLGKVQELRTSGDETTTFGFYVFRGQRKDKGNKRGPNSRTKNRELVTA